MKHPLQNGQSLYLLRKIVSESGFYVLISIFGIKGQCGTQKGIVSSFLGKKEDFTFHLENILTNGGGIIATAY
ncbi:hypothetical protein ASG97_21565 [Bacillus sp. Soil745]|nr:hypothetical protein ASG97_21565 [Bacillus sp. Soil745]